ncbi:MAG: T9SS C-terminal target domain-containing protein [Crocinitomicaceae bacterium]|nr:T9SS C-terminal target domain-containing protein [Crocinitomicaceae bacterium]
MSTEITEESISNSELITKIEAVVYPNPTNGEVNIEFTNELEKNVSIELYDMIGNKVSKSDIPAGSTVGNLTLEGMTSGMYLLQVVNSNNDIIYKTKVSKQ